MGRTILTIFIATIIIPGLVQNSRADELTIFDIQYTEDINGISPQNGNVIDCTGGVVIFKPPSGRPRLIIQDPNNPEGWGTIQVKDLYYAGVFEDVNVGDRVSFTNVLVEEYRGNTFLQYMEDNNAGLTIISKNNTLPSPRIVSIKEIAAPAGGLDTWLVENHNAEKYESMLIKVANVSVTGTGFGKAFDNYILSSNVNPSLSCWTSDYMNADKERGLIYHPNVELDRIFCGVTGILEQYTSESDGIYYDYYQLLTTKTEDLSTEQIADLDGDCDVDFIDFSIFTNHWLEGRE